MSTPYSPGYGQPPNYLSARVNFGWIGESWDIYRNAWLPWMMLFLLPFAIRVMIIVYTFLAPPMQAVFSQLHSGSPMNPGMLPAPTGNYTLISNSLAWGSYGVQFLVACCASDIAVRQVRGEVIEIGSIFRGLRVWPHMLLFFILWILMSAVGLIGCCVGIFVAFGFLIPGFALVADGASAITAFSRSIDGMKRDWGSAAIFSFVMYLILSFWRPVHVLRRGSGHLSHALHNLGARVSGHGRHAGRSGQWRSIKLAAE